MADENRQEVALQRAVEALTPKEAHALRYFKTARQSEIAPSKAAEMYDLYLAGKNCDDIRRLNPGFSLGQIVHARIRDDWDLQREEHQQKLMSTAAPQVIQAQVETSLFLTDLLTAAVKLHWEAIERFLQTGDKTHLKGTPLENGASMKQIREILDTLQSATGQDKRKVVEHRGGVTVNHGPRRVEPDEAAEVLEVLAIEPPKRK